MLLKDIDRQVLQLDAGEVITLELDVQYSTGRAYRISGMTVLSRELKEHPVIDLRHLKLLGRRQVEVVTLAPLYAGWHVVNVELVAPSGQVVERTRFGAYAHAPHPDKDQPSQPPADDPDARHATDATSGFPSRFDFRDELDLGPVPDQGVCGSCWAFATNASIDSRLSEQYLVDCNPWGYGCNGGQWAHDMWIPEPPNGLEPGFVLDEDLPYLAEDAECQPVEHQDDVIQGWRYLLPDTPGEIASPVLIKEALLQYRPVAVSLTANFTFVTWKQGVFPDRYGAGDLEPSNHGIVIVGWDDDLGEHGAWLVRNSWGPEWCEDGHIWIEFGASNVGRDAVVYTDGPQPPAPTPEPFTFLVENVEADPGDLFYTEIRVEDVPGTDCVQAWIEYNPEMLEFVPEESSSGDFMHGNGVDHIAPRKASHSGITFVGLASLCYTTRMFSGSGLLGTLAWRGLREGVSSLHVVEHGEEGLPGSYALDGKARILPSTAVDGAVTVEIPIPDGLPREQYMRVYVLLPEHYGIEWKIAAVKGSHGQRRTVGTSADDAGIGRLAHKTIVAVNPDEIGTGLTPEWYEEHYPGTKYVPLEVSYPAQLELLLKGLRL